MLIRRCGDACVFLLFIFFSLLFFSPVQAFAQGRNLYFTESALKPLKNQGNGAVADRVLDNQIKKTPPTKTRSGKSNPKKSKTRKPDIVITNILRLSLRDVVDNTLKSNVSIAVQEFQSKIRQEQIITQEAVFDPSVSLDANAGKERTAAASFFVQPPVLKTDSINLDLSFNQKLKPGTEYEIKFDNERSGTNSLFAGLSPQYTTRFEVNLTQPLLKNFGVDINKSNIYIANNNLKISDYEFTNKVIEVISNAENVYWDLVFSKEELIVLEQSVERAKDLERRVKAQVEVGTMAPLEILQAQSEVASREEAVIRAQKLIQDNEDNLKNILNISFDSPEGQKEIQPLDSPKFIVEAPVLLRESTLIALKNRPDYLARKKELDNKNIQVKFNENQLYPTLDLVASFGLNGISGRETSPGSSRLEGNLGRSIERAFSGDLPAFEGGLLFKYPLGNRDAESRLAVSKLETAQLLMDIKDLEKTIVLEVREAARQITTDRKRVQAARIARRLAKEKLIAEEKKFEVGLSTSFEVLTFQTDLVEEESKELKAVIDFNKSKINLRKVLATTLEEYDIRMTSDPSK